MSPECVLGPHDLSPLVAMAKWPKSNKQDRSGFETAACSYHYQMNIVSSTTVTNMQDILRYEVSSRCNGGAYCRKLISFEYLNSSLAEFREFLYGEFVNSPKVVS